MFKSAAMMMLSVALALPAAGAEPAAGSTAADTQKQLEQFRADLQAVETEVISKNVSLTTEEATKFWPVFQRFQKEQQAIIDGLCERAAASRTDDSRPAREVPGRVRQDPASRKGRPRGPGEPPAWPRGADEAVLGSSPRPLIPPQRPPGRRGRDSRETFP